MKPRYTYSYQDEDTFCGSIDEIDIWRQRPDGDIYTAYANSRHYCFCSPDIQVIFKDDADVLKKCKIALNKYINGYFNDVSISPNSK